MTPRLQAIAKAAVFKAHITGAEATAEEARLLAQQIGRTDLVEHIERLETALRRVHHIANAFAVILGDDADFGGGAETYSGGHGDKGTTPP